MTAKSNSLSKEDMKEILAHLRSSLDVLENKTERLSASELSLKSMLLTIKRELENELKFRDQPGK